MKQTWRKFKAMKDKLKHLYQRDFANLDKRITQLKEQLDIIQTTLNSNAPDSFLHSQESEYMLLLKKFLVVEESAYKHKSKIRWLQLGDGNNHFFFHAMKDKFAQITLMFCMMIMARDSLRIKIFKKKLCNSIKAY